VSEYQYYEFQAVDRPLTRSEMADLRDMSTRATITPTRFQNVYHWGDLKGDPRVMVERYFDAFVYVANWGTHQFMLRLPKSLLAPETARRYAIGEYTHVHTTRDHTILEFLSEDEENAGWVDDEESEGWMPDLLPLRADLASGDLRSLYLAWLAEVQSGFLDEETIEPPVPAGLSQLSASLEAFARFLRVDQDLIAVAAEGNLRALASAPSSDDLQAWVRQLPAAEKDELLVRLLSDSSAAVRAELLQRFRQAQAQEPDSLQGQRTVAELLAEAERRTKARRRQEAEQAARERERRAAEQAAARRVYLDGLVGREAELWRQVEVLVDTKRPKEYDQATGLLVDLRDLAARQNQPEQFERLLADLVARHAKKPAFLNRLSQARLRA
jgi:hypothetical protein